MSTADRSIEEYALIGNCETAALINAEGGIDWLCLPAFDGPSFFGALLDAEKGGRFTVRPSGPHRIERQYLEDSALLQTRFLTDTGTVKLTDFFVIARKRGNRGYDFTRLHQTRKLVRLIEHESGSPVLMNLTVQARPDYSRTTAQWKPTPDGGFACQQAVFFTNTGAAFSGHDLASEWQARDQGSYFALLDYGENPQAPDLPAVRSWMEITTAFWKHWNYFNYYRGAHEKIVRRSAVTLKLLTHAPSGAFVAAPTTSLPEVVGGALNWDYRYAWVRDTSLFINTLFRIGYSGEATAFLNFAVSQSMRRTQAGKDVLPVLFGIREESETEPRILEHFTGWKKSRPVQIGNRAVEQFQLDNYAHLLEALYFFKTTGGKIDGDKMVLVRQVAEELLKRWREPDNGVWEEVKPSQFTYGKVVAWAALMRAANLTDLTDLGIGKVCAEIQAEVLARSLCGNCGNPYIASRFDSEDLDASSLLIFLNGFVQPQIARVTRQKIEQELAIGPFLYRNLKLKQQGEGAFLLCMFWRINHLVKEGEQSRATELLDQILEMQSPLGLLAEEIDPESRQFLGNFPQAFSHLGLIGSVLNVEQARVDPESHALSDDEKFARSVGATVGAKAIVAGFIRAPKTLRLLFGSGSSKWKEGTRRSFFGITNLSGPSYKLRERKSATSKIPNDATTRSCRIPQEPRYAKALIAGLAGGLAGTAIKTICEIINPPRPPGMESPLGKLIGIVAVMISGHDVPEEIKPMIEKISHWVFGTGAGIVYSLIAEKFPIATIGRGTGFGAVSWMGFHEIFLPLIGSSASPWVMTGREQGNELVSHLLYGFSVESVRRWVRKKL